MPPINTDYGSVDISPRVDPHAGGGVAAMVPDHLRSAAEFGTSMGKTGIDMFRKILTDKIGYDPIQRHAADFGPVGQRILSDPVNNNPLIDALRSNGGGQAPPNPYVRPSIGGWQSLMQRMTPR